MKLKKYITFAVLVSFLFIMGCTGTTTTSTGAYYNCFASDNSMIDAYFDEYAPFSSAANTYQPGEEIDVDVVLVNKMPEDIDAGDVKVKLKGDAILDNIFTGAKTVTSPKLYSIDKDTCLTSEEQVELGPLKYKQDISTTVTKEIAGLYCYAMPVEVKAYLFYTELEEELGVNLPSGSNPPSAVRITQIDQDPVSVSGDGKSAELRFKLTIENTGTGTIIPSLADCFTYIEPGEREDLKVTVTGAYKNIECDEDVRLNRDTQDDTITCIVTGVDPTNLGPLASEITITLYDFAYEDVIDSVNIWIEP
ncbi:MAG: hypothetical protein ABIJ18_00095 [archaeon]